MRLTRTLPSTLLLGAVLLTPSLAAAQRFCSATNSNLRVMNVNADCWLSAQDVPDQIIHRYDMVNSTRIQRIASMILREDPDVVVIEEAYDPACKAQFEASLSSAIYSSRLTRLQYDAFTAGLMVFSKVPFAGFTTPFKGGVMQVDGVRSGVSFNENSSFVAWNRYTSFAPSEVGSSLTAAMVRVLPSGGCPVNVAFTQFGAPELASEQLRTMIVSTLGSAINREPTFVLGEFKTIDGDRNAPPYQFYDSMGNPHTASFDTWRKYFDPTVPDPPNDPFQTSFYRCGTSGFAPGTSCAFNPNAPGPFLTDAWGFEWPSADGAVLSGKSGDHGQTTGSVGQTSLQDVADLSLQTGEREDYILHSQPSPSGTGFLCPQRLKRLFYVDPTTSVQDYTPSVYTSLENSVSTTFKDDKRVSDHFAIVGDFLFSKLARCSPMGLGGPTFGPTVMTTADLSVAMSLGTSTNRRHYNWFRIDTVGTYTVGSSDNTKVNIEVYHHSDLSTPISPYHGVSNQLVPAGGGAFTGPVFDLRDPPYYVRYEPKASAVLPVVVTARIHRHGCTSPDNDFCVLTANRNFNVNWPAGQHVMPLFGAPTQKADAMYFVAAVDRAPSGSHPRVDFKIEVGSSAQFPISRIRLFNKCGYLLNAPDCGSGTCNLPRPLTVPAWADSVPANGFPDLLAVSNNQATGTLAPTNVGTPRLVLLRVQRSCTAASCLATSMSVRYESTLRKVTPVSLTCVDEDDFGFNDDEIYARLVTDTPALGCSSLSGFTSLDRFDENGETNKQSTQFPGTWGFGSRTFVSSAHVTLCEEELPNPADSMGVVSFTATNVPPVGQDEVLITDAFDGDPDAEYHYEYRIKTEDHAAQAESCP